MKYIIDRLLLILAVLLAAALSLCYGAYLPLSSAFICTLAISCFLSDGRKTKWLLFAVSFALLTAGFITGRLSLHLIAGIAAMTAAETLLVMDIRGGRHKCKIKRSVRKKITGIAGWAANGIVLLLASLLFLIPFCANALCSSVMSAAAPKQAAVSSDVTDDNITAVCDVEYPSSYPNNTLTVYEAPNAEGTIFYIHGGGFVSSDKDADYEKPLIRKWLQAGVSVVSVDYALAPEYRYPTQITECNDALRYIVGHCADYGIDPEKIVFCGDSAGGQLAGQLADIQTNAEYAASMGIEAAMSGGLKPAGFISMCGLLDFPKCAQTGLPLADVVFNLCGVIEFNDVDYAVGPAAKEASVIDNATADFPPSYLSEGNTCTFTEQAKAFEKKLKDLGVPVTVNFPQTPTLYHIWEFSVETDSGSKNAELQVRFLHSVFEK